MLHILGETLLIIAGNLTAKPVRAVQDCNSDAPAVPAWRRPKGTPRLG